MSFKNDTPGITIASGVLATLFTSYSVVELAGAHNVGAGSIFAAIAAGSAICSINSCVKASFRAAMEELSKEIKPTEAGSPAPEAAKPAPKP